MREDWREDVAARGNDTRRGLTTSAASHTTLFVCQVKPALQRTGDLSSCMAHAYKDTVLFSSTSHLFFFLFLVVHQITPKGTRVEMCPRRRRRRGDGGGRISSMDVRRRRRPESLLAASSSMYSSTVHINPHSPDAAATHTRANGGRGHHIEMTRRRLWQLGCSTTTPEDRLAVPSFIYPETRRPVEFTSMEAPRRQRKAHQKCLLPDML